MLNICSANRLQKQYQKTPYMAPILRRQRFGWEKIRTRIQYVLVLWTTPKQWQKAKYLPHIRSIHSFVKFSDRHSYTFVWPDPGPHRNEMARAHTIKVAWNRGFANVDFRRKWRDRICQAVFVTHFRSFRIDELAQGLERTMSRTLIGRLLLTNATTWRMEITKNFKTMDWCSNSFSGKITANSLAQLERAS
jgi:hypothetical protein